MRKRVLLLLGMMLVVGVCIAAAGSSVRHDLRSVSSSEAGAAAATLALPEGMLWLSLACFLVLSGFFSASETALFSLNKVQLHKLEDGGRRGFRAIRRLLDQPNETLVTILAGNTFVNIAATLSGGALIERHLGTLPTVSFLLSAVGVTLLILVFGEVTPKTFVIQRAEGVALRTAPVMLLLSRAVLPVRGAAMAISNALFRLLGVHVPKQEWALTEEELRALLTFGEVGAILEEDEQEMIESVLELGETFVEEIMTPRTWIEGFPADTPQEVMVEQMKRAKHTRVLLYDGNLDRVVGLLYVKDFWLHPERGYGELMREPLFVPTKKKLISLLQEFKRKRSQFAVVVDEYGGTAGLVTMHDLLEEIVGEIRDRGQKGTLEEIIRIADGEFLVPGKTEIWILNEELGLNLPDDMGRTLSGFMINSLGHFPEQYETVDLGGYRFRVLRVEHRRIVHVHIKKISGDRTLSEEQAEG
jgi:putative hemolysin